MVDEQVMLAFPMNTNTQFEAWRPIMESTCGNAIWEYNVHSLAWNQDWKLSKQVCHSLIYVLCTINN